MSRVVVRRPVLRVRGEHLVDRPDSLVVEEPLEIRVAGTPLVVTMRTPGHDVELAHGFLHGEGLLRGREDVINARYCDSVDDAGVNTYNVLDLAMSAELPAPEPNRNFYATSSCGVCGKASLDAIETLGRFDIAADTTVVDAGVLEKLPDLLRSSQKVFDSTGGVHAAGLFTADGTPLAVREDVGRHNAVDKVVGRMLMDGQLPPTGTVLMVSGRASFELVQKAVLAGIPILAAVSAPSSLAVDLAERSGLTIVGFLRGASMNIYTHPHRIDLSDR